MVNSGWKSAAIALGAALLLVTGTVAWQLGSWGPTKFNRLADITRTVEAPFPPPAAITEGKDPEDGVKFFSAWMPLSGYPTAKDQSVEWSVGVTFDGRKAEFGLYLRSETPSWTCWEAESKVPAIVFGDGRRGDLKCRRDEHRPSGKVWTLMACDGTLADAVVIARANRPQFLFGSHLCDLGPKGASTCRELVRRAGLVEQRLNGVTGAAAERNIKNWLGEK